MRSKPGCCRQEGNASIILLKNLDLFLHIAGNGLLVRLATDHVRHAVIERLGCFLSQGHLL